MRHMVYSMNREEFLQALIHFPRLPTTLTWEHRQWLAAANLIWAVGSLWLTLSHIPLPNNRNPGDNHLMYYARPERLALIIELSSTTQITNKFR